MEKINQDFIDRTKLKLYRLNIDMDIRILIDYSTKLFNSIMCEEFLENKKIIFICCLLIVIKYCIDDTYCLNKNFKTLFFIDLVKFNELEIIILKKINFNICSIIKI